ncbi:MAG: adenosylcobinamide-GDP ribazoletransferase [Clostridia bacterium]|nr:adenosylcobinamide-GDP ribazoletransferase [Clostridia bacterium]
MLKSIIIAFSTYSKIPMPRIEWNEKSMKYSLCFFPLVGLVTGIIEYCVFYLLYKFNMGIIFKSMLLTVMPIIINGGIHMDGFLDTIDAKSSYKPRDEKIKILKDPNTGAFAVIYAVIYIMVTFGFFSEAGLKEMPYVCMGYIYSRVLSGFSVVAFKKAKRDGMAAAEANSADGRVKYILIFEFILCCGVYMSIDPVRGLICVLAGLGVMLYYRNMAYKLFGGITGDLAGYFLQLCEICILICIVIMKGLIL